MQVSLLVDQNIGVLDGCTSVLSLRKISLQKVENSSVLFGIHSVILVKSYQKCLLSNQQVPEQTIKRFFILPILMSCDFFNPFFKLLFVIKPKRNRIVFKPVPCDLLRLKLSCSFFFIERAHQMSYLHAAELFAFHDCTLG